MAAKMAIILFETIQNLNKNVQIMNGSIFKWLDQYIEIVDVVRPL